MSDISSRTTGIGFPPEEIESARQMWQPALTRLDLDAILEPAGEHWPAGATVRTWDGHEVHIGHICGVGTFPDDQIDAAQSWGADLRDVTDGMTITHEGKMAMLVYWRAGMFTVMFYKDYGKVISEHLIESFQVWVSLLGVIADSEMRDKTAV